MGTFSTPPITQFIVYTYRLLYSLFQLSRPISLLLEAFSFNWAAYFSVHQSFDFLKQKNYWLELLLILLILASGYWINDVVDQKIDQINKPHKIIIGNTLSRKKALTAYFLATSFILICTIWLLPFRFWILNFFAVGVLFFYTSHLKKHLAVANFTVAILSGLTIVAGAVLLHFKIIHLWGIIFIFSLNLLREITKDIEDVEGDLEHGLHTLPTLVGIRTTQNFLIGGHLYLLALQFIFLIFYYFQYHILPLFFIAILFFFVILPILNNLYLLIKAQLPHEYHIQRQNLQWITVTNMVSFLFLPIV
ncbi:MAG: UbiA family prenyltransferase [Bacteroidia bacterium]|nr:UbiA family prenyltransferase [Bacteroidia bacterium]MDW8158362.1 UbiA family prenyltransferase [Bacteroidia bacterium]